jgi:ribonuclease BN (tRNA processing enzyme)
MKALLRFAHRYTSAHKANGHNCTSELRVPLVHRVVSALMGATVCLSPSVFAHSSYLQGNGEQISSTASHGSDESIAPTCHAVSLQVLGSGGPELDDGRTSSGYVVWVEGKARVLVDAGSGSSVQFGASGAQFADLSAILLTHLHTDHAADLPSYVKGSFFTSRDSDLALLGPDGNDVMPSTSAYLKTLLGQDGAYRYLSSYTQKAQDDYTIYPTSVSLNASLSSPFVSTLSENVTVEAISVHHGPIPAVAWKVKANGCTLVFSGDTNDKSNTLSAFAASADLLVLNNAVDDNAGAVARNLHMTPKQIIAIAKASGAKRVLLSHIMKRSEPGLAALLEAVSVVAPGRVYGAKELMNITLGKE